MADLEKVLNGLKCCAEDVNEFNDCLSNDCPYKHKQTCCSDMARDALVLLKAQHPRVLTVDEIEDALDEVVWVEIPNCDNTSERYALVAAYSRKTVYYLRDFECGNDMRMYLYTEYNKTWRCWSARPTDEQRKAVKWDD